MARRRLLPQLDAGLLALLGLSLIVGGLGLLTRVASVLFWAVLAVYIAGLIWGLLSRVFRSGAGQGRPDPQTGPPDPPGPPIGGSPE
jgi:hypothetical protein